MKCEIINRGPLSTIEHLPTFEKRTASETGMNRRTERRRNFWGPALYQELVYAIKRRSNGDKRNETICSVESRAEEDFRSTWSETSQHHHMEAHLRTRATHTTCASQLHSSGQWKRNRTYPKADSCKRGKKCGSTC
jgi:hypothetical protein